MNNIKFYEINSDYIDYLSPFAPHLFHNSKTGQSNKRKYIGIVLQINGFSYFAPISSFKQKHNSMVNRLDFLKIKTYAVINLNNMFPVPVTEYRYVDFNTVIDPKYKSLLLSEYRYIKSIQDTIIKNSAELYKHKIVYDCKTPLARRCNDFILLEEKCKEYTQKIAQKEFEESVQESDKTTAHVPKQPNTVHMDIKSISTTS